MAKWLNEFNTEITVATWNLLCPAYALKHREREGLTNGKDNWNIRGPIMAELIAESEIDVLLLQEITAVGIQLRKFGQFKSMMALMKPVLEKRYHIVHYTHSGRAARDGCAVLLLKSTFALTNRYPHYVSFRSKKLMLEEKNLNKKSRNMDHNLVNYMVTAFAEATHLETKRKFRFASTHWYKKKAKKPERSLLTKLELLAKLDQDPVVTVWGGDLNTSRVVFPDFTMSKGGAFTWKGRCIDWIFVNSEAGVFERKNAKAQNFITATMNELEDTSETASSHFADAVSLKF